MEFAQLIMVNVQPISVVKRFENFIVKATKESEEIQGLLEAGSEYVCQKDGLMFFRKRK